jgi:hypothetical protein
VVGKIYGLNWRTSCRRSREGNAKAFRAALNGIRLLAHRDRTAWLGMSDSKCAGRPARSRWCKSTTMKE